MCDSYIYIYIFDTRVLRLSRTRCHGIEGRVAPTVGGTTSRPLQRLRGFVGVCWVGLCGATSGGTFVCVATPHPTVLPRSNDHVSKVVHRGVTVSGHRVGASHDDSRPGGAGAHACAYGHRKVRATGVLSLRLASDGLKAQKTGRACGSCTSEQWWTGRMDQHQTRVQHI